jgi:RNA polymerase primary sigma factor
LIDGERITAEQRILEREMTDGVGEVFELLNHQQKTVIRFRFGLDGQPPLTLQETGDQMGLSRERVRQIECQAKERMRKLFNRRRSIDAPVRRPIRGATARVEVQTRH